MATKRLTITGEAYWAKVFEGNREMKDYQGNPHTFDGLYKIEVKLDKENRAILKASGSALKGKFNDDGEFLVTFKRKHKDKFDWASGAPKVTKEDGTVWDYNTDGPIGNKSLVEVDISVYTTSMTPGTRLESVKVTKAEALPIREEQPTPPTMSEAPKKPTSGIEVPF